MEKVLYIVRGIPGSGKTTFAKSLNCPVFEADMFFVNSQGIYNFDYTKINSDVKHPQRKNYLSQIPKITGISQIYKHINYIKAS